MDLFNRGAQIVTVVTALAMVLCNQYGYSFDSPQMHLVMGITIIPIALILEVYLMKPYFLYLPLWLLGFIPLMSGLWQIGGWPYLFFAAPIILLCRIVHARNETARAHTALKVSHNLLNVDPDKLRKEIEENRSHHSTPPKPHSR